LVPAARILRHDTTRGTQDVNDPDRPGGRIAGPEAGSFTSWVPLLTLSATVIRAAQNAALSVDGRIGGNGCR
jgi:hypothetical protein